MDVHRGVVTQPDNPVDAYYRTAAELGLDYVEVMLDGPTDRHWLTTDGADLLDSYDDLDLVVHLPFEGFDLGSPVDGIRDAVVEELHACHTAAAEAGADKSVLHPNALAWQKAHGAEALVDRVIESIRLLREYADRDGLDITITVENIYNAAVELDDFERLLEETGAAMTFDTGHARIEGYDQQAMAEFVAAHTDHISHFHLNDTRGPTDEHLPVGAGSIDFARLFAALPQSWTGSASLEVTTPSMEYIEYSAHQLDRILSDGDTRS